jgi:hypothetical protein
MMTSSGSKKGRSGRFSLICAIASASLASSCADGNAKRAMTDGNELRGGESMRVETRRGGGRGARVANAATR